MVAALQRTEPGMEPRLVTKYEIAERARVRFTTVVGWVLRCRDFPEPREGSWEEPVWLWTDVEAWLRSSGRGEG